MAVFVTLAGAVSGTLTVSNHRIAGAGRECVTPGAGRVPSAQLHRSAADGGCCQTGGSVSVTVTVPLVAAVPELVAVME